MSGTSSASSALRRALRGVRYFQSDVALGASRSDGLRFWRLRHFPADGDISEAVRFTTLGGQCLYLRPGTADAQVTWYTLRLRAPLPPPHIGSPRVIVDLGANIGVATALLATRFPEATILAVEPDPDNAAAWRRNIAPWTPRCELVQGAIWNHAGKVFLKLHPGAEDAAQISESGDGIEVKALTLQDIVAKVGEIDYLKVNVEGAERELLLSDGWEHVAVVKIEVHQPYTAEECCRELTALGFVASIQSVGPDSFALGVRADAGG